jgi:hypothetical protein
MTATDKNASPKKNTVMRAAFGASLSVPAVFLIFFLIALFQPSRGHATGAMNAPAALFLFTIFSVPVSLVAVLVVIVPLTRYYGRRGYATLGFMTIAGAVVGAVLPLLIFIYQRIKLMTGSGPFGEYMSGTTAMQVSLLVGVGTAVTTAVYWKLLNPLAHDQRS